MLGACGFQAAGTGEPPGIDAPVIDGSPGVVVDAPANDAPADAAPATCWARWLAGNPVLSAAAAVPGINSSSYDRDPAVSADDLTIVFSSARSGTSGGGDFWTATRATRAGTFAAATQRADLNSSASETRASISGDGLLAAIGTSRSGGEGGIDIWLGSRVLLTDGFTGFSQTLLGAVNDGDAQHDPFLSADGLRLYLAPTTGGQHIEVATRATLASTFASPDSLIDSASSDADPWVSPDERVIVFSSDRAGTIGSADVWFATRATVGDAFGTAIQLSTAVNTTASDGDPALSADGCQLYFSSNRAGGTGDFDLYVATVTP